MTGQASRRVSGRLRTAALGVVPMLLAVAAPAVLWDHGCFEEETTTFVRQYTAEDGRSVLQKVFDPHANDLETYQARELSYLIDLADAHAYPYLARWIEPGFSLPVSAVAASVLLVLVFMAGSRDHARNCGPLNAALLLACLVTSFCFVSTMGLFYRSAKPVLAVVVVAWVFLLLRIVHHRQRVPDAHGRRITGGAIGIFLLTAAAGLLDRQGAYMAVVAAALLIVHVRRTGELFDVSLAAGAGVIVAQVYAFVAGPWIIHSLNGYWPDFAYQQVPAGELLRLPNHLLRAASLLAQNTLLLFGGNWLASGAVAALVVGMFWSHAAGHGRGSPRTWVVSLRRLGRGSSLRTYMAWVALSQLLMFALMIARHGYVYRWIDHRLWYYPIPFLALAACGALLALNAWMPALRPSQRRIVPLVLAAVVASNVLSLTDRRDVMATGPWFGQIYPQCQLLKASLRRGTPDPSLARAYRALFDHSLAAQVRVREGSVPE